MRSTTISTLPFPTQHWAKPNLHFLTWTGLQGSQFGPKLMKAQLTRSHNWAVLTEEREMGDAKGGRKNKAKTESEWPAIKPKSVLQINRLKSNDLITVPNFLTATESKAFVQVAESLGFVRQGSLGPAHGEAFRDNDRISVNDPLLADVIWEAGLNKLFTDIKYRGKVAVGLNPNIRFYRYNVGQRFGRHIDESVDLGNGRHTLYTLLIYLSGSSQSKGKSEVEILVGGETVFYGPRNRLVAEVAPDEGMALVHIHGDKCMLHEARNVTKGVKYVFRSDVIFA